ncbi:hypothetical protein [Pelagibaculum spongiae]|nr:hypothetical protein [Pelagibaculum spongiae]
MSDIEVTVIYTLYVLTNSYFTYLLLRWKCQEPKSIDSKIIMFIINYVFIGALIVAPLLMKKPPRKNKPMTAWESVQSSNYYERGRIWFWQD